MEKRIRIPSLKMVISGLPGLCESPEIPQGASPGSSHEWGGLEHFPRFRFVPTNTNVQKAGWEGDVREGCHGSWAVTRHIQQQGQGWGQGWGAGTGSAALPQTAPRFPARKRSFLTQKANLGGRWKGQDVAASAQSRRYNSLEFRCMPGMLGYNSFPKHSTPLCSSGSLEHSAVQKGGPLLIRAMTQADLFPLELSIMSGSPRSALLSAARLFQVTPVTSAHNVMIQIGRCLLPENFIPVSSALWAAVGGSNPLSCTIIFQW